MEDARFPGSVVLRKLYPGEGHEEVPGCSKAVDLDHGEVPPTSDLMWNAEDEGLLEDPQVNLRRLLLPCVPQGSYRGL